jgi:transposase-like protein
MAKAEYPNEVKAAVMAALLEGQSISAVAKQYQIPKGTVSGWKQKAFAGADIKSSDPVATQKREEIGNLLLDYLRTMLGTLRIQAEHFGDKNWLKGQGANELAVLHGVSTDKAIRLLEALAPSESEE